MQHLLLGSSCFRRSDATFVVLGSSCLLDSHATFVVLGSSCFLDSDATFVVLGNSHFLDSDATFVVLGRSHFLDSHATFVVLRSSCFLDSDATFCCWEAVASSIHMQSRLLPFLCESSLHCVHRISLHCIGIEPHLHNVHVLDWHFFLSFSPRCLFV